MTAAIFLAILLLYSATIITLEDAAEEQSNTILRAKVEKRRFHTNFATKVEGFVDLVAKSRVFVDKTLLIEKFLTHPARTVLMSCPRGWGKTVNIDMIKGFLEMKIDAEGNEVTPEKDPTPGYKLFFQNEVTWNKNVDRLGDPLLITKNQQIMQEYLAKHPVIFIDWEEVTSAENYEKLEVMIQRTISRVFKDYSYMSKILKNAMGNMTATAEEREKAETVSNTFERYIQKNELNVTDIEYSLNFLCEVLHKHFRKRVFVLIDDYDQIINAVFQNNNFPQNDQTKVVKFFRNFIRYTFKENQHLNRGFLTGKYRTKKITTTAEDGFEEHTLYDSPFTEYYGFQKKDVLAALVERNIPEVTKGKMLDFYGAFQFLNHDTLFYNTWSIANAMNSVTIKQYWSDNKGVDIVDKLIESSGGVRKEILILLRLVKLAVRKNADLNLGALLDFKQYAHDALSSDEKCLDLFHAYLPVGGYISKSIETVVVQGTKSEDTLMKLGSKEIAFCLTKKLVTYYTKIYQLDERILRRVGGDMEVYFINDYHDSLHVRHFLNLHFSGLSVFPEIMEGFQKNDQTTKEIEHLLIHIVLLRMQANTNFEHVLHYKDLHTVTLFYSAAYKRGALLKLEYENKDPAELIDTMKQLKGLFRSYKGIETMKYIVINVKSDRNLTLHADFEWVKNDTTSNPATTVNVTNLT